MPTAELIGYYDPISSVINNQYRMVKMKEVKINYPDKVAKARSKLFSFLLYEDSAPDNYIEILNELHVPYVLSPWHDKDINHETGELKKKHRHGALKFESNKSIKQVLQMLEPLKLPKHIEIVHSPKGLYDYFIHANNPDKAQYDINDIVSGCGFDLDKFINDQNPGSDFIKIMDLIYDNEIYGFEQLVLLLKSEYPLLLVTLVNKAFFFDKLLHSRIIRKINENNEKRDHDAEQSKS